MVFNDVPSHTDLAAMNERTIQAPHTRIARLPEVCEIVGLSPSSVWNRLNERGRWFDPEFPKPVRLGRGKRCAIGWRVDLLHAYIEAKRNVT